MQNHSYENDFDLHENEAACRTHFHMKGFALRLVLKQRHKRTRKWPIYHVFVVSSLMYFALHCIAWHCMVSHLHYIALHRVAFALHGITLHYLTFILTGRVNKEVRRTLQQGENEKSSN